MKRYKEALLIIEQTATPDAKHNKLIKLALETEDAEFEKLLRASAKMYSYHLKSGWTRTIDPDEKGCIPRGFHEWVEMQKNVNENLKLFVQIRLEANKPEWQVLAEKNGWTANK